MRTPASHLLAAALLAALLTGQDQPAPPAPPSPNSPLADRVDAYLEAMAELDLFSGAVLLARGDEVLERAVGLADREAGRANTPQTRFKLMSVSKTFTGVAVLQLVQAGRLGLEDPVGEHLPDWPEAWGAVTVHHLLDHTSGIPNLDVAWSDVSRRLHGGDGDPSLAAIWREFAPTAVQPLQGEPGAAHRYSNFNTVLAGLVAELVSGRRYPALVRAEILAPAGLTGTGFDDGGRHPGLAIGYFLGRDGAPEASEQNMAHIQPAGGYWSTVGDLYRFDRALRDDSLLGAVARRQLVTPRGPQTYGYACCFRNSPIHGRPSIHHSGGANGYVADFLRFPDDDACVVALSNYAFAPIGRVSRDLTAMLFDLEVELPVAVDDAALAACAGVYDEGRGVYRVMRRTGRALVAFSVWPGLARASGQLLLPLGQGRFRAARGDAVLTFAAGEAGRELRLGGKRVPRVAEVPSWDDAAGAWGVEGGGEATLAREGDALRLRSEGLWPAAADIVPVSGEVALALIGPTGGVVLRRQGGSLRYRDYRGETVELVRR